MKMKNRAGSRLAEAGEFENMGWNVKNRLTGQVFTHIPGRTPMDAKRHLLATQPLLRGVSPVDLAAFPFGTEDPDVGGPPSTATGSGPHVQPNASSAKGTWPDADRPSRSARFTKNEPFSYDDELPTPSGRETPGSSMQTAQIRGPRGRRGPNSEGAGAAAMGANGPMGRDPRKEAFKAVVRRAIGEIVRKKKGGGGYALYAPNKGKKKSPKPVGEFPTRLAAKRAELARFPPKDPEQLKRARARLDKLNKDPKKRAEAERRDLSGAKRSKKSGPPAHDRKKRKEELVRLMAQDLHEHLFPEASFGLGKSGDPRHCDADLDDMPNRGSHRPRASAYDKGVSDRNHKPSRRDHSIGKPVTERLFHEDEIPGSPWDEHMSSLHPDAISSDRKLHALHRGMEKASIGALGDAHRGLAKALRGIVKVQPGDVSFDSDRKKTFMPVTMDCDGYEIGPVHLYVDGGHVRIELSQDARQAIAQLEPDTARDLRGGLMSFEEDHLPRIDGAQRAWRDRDAYLDKLHGRLEKHAAGLSGVEHHILKGLLGKKGKGRK